MHVKDCLTDLQGQPIDFLGGKAHAGMAQTASLTLKKVYPLLIEALRSHHGYGLVILGHSLGAATASLITMLILEQQSQIEEKIGYPLKIQCHAFAPPCIVDLALSTKYRSFIRSYIVGDDVVPRISLGSLHRLKALSVELMKNSKGNFHRIFQALSSPANSMSTSTDTDSLSVNRELIEKLQKTPLDLTESLFPAGQLYHLFCDGKTTEDEAAMRDGRRPIGIWRMEKTNFSFFGDIVISTSMLTDHLPNTYETAFQGILRRQNEQRAAKGLFYFLHED